MLTADRREYFRSIGLGLAALAVPGLLRGAATVTTTAIHSAAAQSTPNVTTDGHYRSPASRALLEAKMKEGRDKGLAGQALARYARGPATECADVADEAYLDGIIAKTAIEQLRDVKEKPFFMCVGFRKPHLPFCAPKKYWDMYKRDDFAVPDRKTPEAMPPIALQGFGELRSYCDIPGVEPVDDAGSRKLIHGYHACVSFTDAQVGKVVGELERLGLARNTIVVIWGDHGWKLGEYGSWCKHTKQQTGENT